MSNIWLGADGIEEALDKNNEFWEFPGSPVVSTWYFHCCGLGSVPGQGTKISQVMQCGQTSNEILLRKFQNILQKMNT